MVGGKMMQIVWKGQGGGGRRCVRPEWKGGAYEPEPGASDSEGVEEASAADNAAWAEEAAWATDMSSLVFVFGALGRGGEWREPYTKKRVMNEDHVSGHVLSRYV